MEIMLKTHGKLKVFKLILITMQNFYSQSNKIYLPKKQEYFKECFESHIFMPAEIKDKFIKTISSNEQILEKNDRYLNDPEVNIAIKNEIIRCIIKESQY